MRTKQSGFTLLEVLLAGFILFLVLSSTTLIYKGALLSSGKAERNLSISAAVPSIRVLISKTFSEVTGTFTRSGAGSYGALDFKWDATLVSRGVSTEVAGEESTRRSFYLWDVKLELKKGNVVRNYNFREVSL